ncbi:MAG TPA: LytTR family DNA-binding domain-containing protein [Chitinophagales bacterium]|nr:LytTR family DNA-binding domain-containing protein [Chitinophagales bacterium]
MNICIIDDEKDNRDILTYIINKHHKEVVIIGEGDSVQNGVKIINLTKPDLIFLDIEMPDGTGFDLIKQLDEHKPEIIFCTAYNQFALKAIECSALAYVLKPIIKTSIADALQKANKKVDANNKVLQYEVLNEQLKNQTKDKARFLLSNSDKMHVIYVDELICCIAHSNYTDIHLENNKKITVAKTLKEIENILNNYSQFIRIHQSNIINIDKIIDLLKADNNLSVQLNNKMELAVSRSKKDELMSKIPSGIAK